MHFHDAAQLVPGRRSAARASCVMLGAARGGLFDATHVLRLLSALIVDQVD